MKIIDRVILYAGIASLCALLTGCAGGAAAGGAAIASTALTIAQGIPVVLSDTAQLGCAIQAVANAQGNSLISRVAGTACKW